MTPIEFLENVHKTSQLAYPSRGDTNVAHAALTGDTVTALSQENSGDVNNRVLVSQDVLGEGKYGVVYKGTLDEISVAVLTTKTNPDMENFPGFLLGIKVVNYIGEHPNILQFHGAVVENSQQRVCYAVFELSPFGSLNNYLRHYARNYVDVTSEDSQERLPRVCDGSEPSMDLNQAVLISFCKQIASAMAYIAQNKVVHRDLAARNVLVFPNNVVKITDFQMSRQLSECPNYLENEPIPMPWRWMALESLRYMDFSSQSDVWSFGVTVWEIFSLGAIPFSGVNWSSELPDEIEAGLRLSKPEFASPEMFNWMMKCWEKKPEKRPTFKDCLGFFTNSQ